MTQRELLAWLALEDESFYGECEGPLLDALVAQGLVAVRWAQGKPAQYGRVSVTDAGYAMLAARGASHD